MKFLNRKHLSRYFYLFPFTKIGLLGIPMLFFVFLMESYYPKHAPSGYHSFIVAFEFARTPAQIHALLGGFSAEMMKNVDMGNYLDFGFTVTYGLFLILFFRQGAKLYRKRWLLTGIPLLVVVVLADITENFLLLQIIDVYSPNGSNTELANILSYLHRITWVKWGGLAVIFSLYAVKLMGSRVLLSIEGIAYTVPLGLSVWAVTNNPTAVSRFTLSITLVFFLLIFNCFRYHRKIKKPLIA